jgi:hypothetical protein
MGTSKNHGNWRCLTPHFPDFFAMGCHPFLNLPSFWCVLPIFCKLGCDESWDTDLCLNEGSKVEVGDKEPFLEPQGGYSNKTYLGSTPVPVVVSFLCDSVPGFGRKIHAPLRDPEMGQPRVCVSYVDGILFEKKTSNIFDHGVLQPCGFVWKSLGKPPNFMVKLIISLVVEGLFHRHHSRHHTFHLYTKKRWSLMWNMESQLGWLGEYSMM